MLHRQVAIVQNEFKGQYRRVSTNIRNLNMFPSFERTSAQLPKKPRRSSIGCSCVNQVEKTLELTTNDGYKKQCRALRLDPFDRDPGLSMMDTCSGQVAETTANSKPNDAASQPPGK